MLDEPLQYLDLRPQLLVMTLFRELAVQGGAVMMALYDIIWASRYCDHVLMLFNNGCAIAGSAEEILSHSNLEALYQCNLGEFGEDSVRHFVPETMPGV